MSRISFIFNRKNLIYNIDKVNSDNNIIYVTGLSGSGKTTLSKKLSNEYHAMLFELDNLGGFFWEYKNSQNIIHALTDKFLNENIELKNIIEKGKYVTLKMNNFNEYSRWTNKYISYLEEYAHNQNQIFIFEGTQLFKCISPLHFKDKPFIIVRTSSLNSLIRRLNRHYKIDKENNKPNFFKKHLWKLLNDSKHLHFKDYKCLNTFIKILNTKR